MCGRVCVHRTLPQCRLGRSGHAARQGGLSAAGLVHCATAAGRVCVPFRSPAWGGQSQAGPSTAAWTLPARCERKGIGICLPKRQPLPGLELSALAIQAFILKPDVTKGILLTLERPSDRHRVAPSASVTERMRI